MGGSLRAHVGSVAPTRLLTHAALEREAAQASLPPVCLVGSTCMEHGPLCGQGDHPRDGGGHTEPAFQTTFSGWKRRRPD